ncbi:MAG: signal peptidase I [Holosporales bacterium]|jgi:signal peptidase I|nr:signal peptidase I [Holosporales bacterium]
MSVVERFKRWWKKEALSFFGLLFCALAFRSCVYEMFQIPSGSMEPSLLVGDMPLVEKWAYGYSKHAILLSPPLFDGRIFSSSPKRGEVVVFKLPSDHSTNLIKRVIGLPGDRIQVIRGIVHVNGEPARLSPLETKHLHEHEQSRFVTECYEETLPGCAESHVVAYYPPAASSATNNTQEFRVPERHYFMMGDNRDFSKDCRYKDIGFIHEDLLIGRAAHVVYSMGNGVRWWEFWRWFQNIRYDRLWNRII